MLMMLADLKNMFYPLFSLSELPDRFLGFDLSLLRHPFSEYYTLLSIISTIHLVAYSLHSVELLPLRLLR